MCKILLQIHCCGYSGDLPYICMTSGNVDLQLVTLQRN